MGASTFESKVVEWSHEFFGKRSTVLFTIIFVLFACFCLADLRHLQFIKFFIKFAIHISLKLLLITKNIGKDGIFSATDYSYFLKRRHLLAVSFRT